MPGSIDWPTYWAMSPAETDAYIHEVNSMTRRREQRARSKGGGRRG